MKMSQHTPGSSEEDLVILLYETNGASGKALSRLLAAAPAMVTWLEAFISDYAPNAIELAQYRSSARALLAKIEEGK